MTDSAARFDPLIAGIRAIFGEGPIPLHRPVFEGNERQYLVDCIDSNFVSSVGAQVTAFEARIATFTGAGFAVATVNGTAALQVALQLAGVGPETEVLTQALTFVATCNAIRYNGAWPVFVDVDRDTLGLSPAALRAFFDALRGAAGGRGLQPRQRPAPGGLRPHAHLWSARADPGDRGPL